MKPERIVFATGVKMNGIAINGFNTIGKPKMIGSLIPKIPAGRESFPRVFKRLDFAKKAIMITSANVDPPPPKLQKKSENPEVKMFVISRPALAAS